MLLFKRNPYKLQNKIPQPFRHEMYKWEIEREGVCVSCGRKIKGILYYCPVCKEYYCLECAPKSIGGNTCPHCHQLTFLQRVKEIS